MGSAGASESSIDYLKTVDTPTLSNAIELLQLRPQSEGFTPLSVRCLFPEFGRMVGYAVTAQVETMSEGLPTGTYSCSFLKRSPNRQSQPSWRFKKWGRIAITLLIVVR